MRTQPTAMMAAFVRLEINAQTETVLPERQRSTATTQTSVPTMDVKLPPAAFGQQIVQSHVTMAMPVLRMTSVRAVHARVEAL